MKKKGDGNTFWIIISAVIALFVVVFVIYWFESSGRKSFGFTEKKIGELGDCDKDNIADMFDKCSCDPRVGEDYPPGVSRCGEGGTRECTPEEKANCQKCSQLTSCPS